MDPPPVQYVRTGDGYNIAFRVTGSGPPLLFIPPNLSDIELVWRFYLQWLEGLARRFQLVQYDSRGEGLSTRNLSPEVTMADFDRDIQAVVERLRLDRFFIWGFAGRSHLAVSYAVAHPERVAGLILNTCSVSNLVWKPVLFSMLPDENWEAFLNAVAPPGFRLMSEGGEWMSFEPAVRARTGIPGLASPALQTWRNNWAASVCPVLSCTHEDFRMCRPRNLCGSPP
jgi:pimeloyl-ACP methyl ester carboxylesterase